ncbi:MAG: hypothetical protein J5794_03190 [Lachnospiraceae bacterium]|nr:hypothetical protein [Lachnospiraceae bacterium]
MKRVLIILSAAVLSLAALSSCAVTTSETTKDETAMTSEKETLKPTEPVSTASPEPETMDPAEEADLLIPNRLRASDVAKIPVAADSMTPAERRQLILDYFTLQLSFVWRPDRDLLDYPTTYLKDQEKGKTIEKTNLYGGIPYQSTGTGNLYRWLEYYDESTGVFHFDEAFAENGGYGPGASISGVKTDLSGNVTYKKYTSFRILFNQCSVASFWGWGRVINSANFIWTGDMNVYNGFIPVGCYTYPRQEILDQFGEVTGLNPTKYDTKNVIADWIQAHGEDAMYRCYAQLKPADCLVSGGHARMAKSVQIKVREDGSIDYANSEVTVIEQIEGWGYQGTLNGRTFIRQGGIDRTYSFEELQRTNYLPFTFAELLDPGDPQDQAHLEYYYRMVERRSPIAKRYQIFEFSDEEVKAMTGISVEQAIVFNTLGRSSGSIGMKELQDLAVGSNYPISDVFVIIRDAAGNEPVRNIYRAMTANIREVRLTAERSRQDRKPLYYGAEAYTNGAYTVEISLQLSTGEKLVTFSGTLTE